MATLSQSTWARLAQQEVTPSSKFERRFQILDEATYPSSSSSSSSSCRKTTNGFFDRMSKTETVATAYMKGKIDKSPPTKKALKKTTNAFFERMSKTDTFSTAKAREMELGVEERQNKHKSARMTTNDFFERMSKTHTLSSTAKARGFDVEEREDKQQSIRLTNNDFFERMSKTDTFSTAKARDLAVGMKRGNKIKTTKPLPVWHRK